MRNIKVISDGTPGGSKVTDAETGEDVAGAIRGIVIEVTASGTVAKITYLNPEVDVVAEEVEA